MADSLRASTCGLELVDQARRKNRWTKTVTSEWWKNANTTQATLKRFWRRVAIDRYAFEGICNAVGVNWEEVVDRNEIQETEDDDWVGRQELIAQLTEKVQGSCRVLILTGITGIGKTALAERLALELQPDSNESFSVNFDTQENADFSSVAAQLLTGWQKTVTPDDRKEPQRLLSWLVKHLREHRYLMLIDSLELILKGNSETGWSDFQDEWWEKFFQSLLSAESCGSRIILTSQDLPGQLEAIGLRYLHFWHCQFLRGLSQSEQLELFEKAKLDASTESPGRTYLERIGVAYEGHPLALRVIAGEIATHPFNGNVVAYWKQYGHEIEEVEKARQQVKVESADDEYRLERYTRSLQRAVKQQVEKTFKRLARDVPHAYMLLCLGSVYRRPVPETFWLKPLERLGFNEEKQRVVLDALRDRYLVEEEVINDDLLLRQHNLIRSVGLVHLKNWRTGE